MMREGSRGDKTRTEENPLRGVAEVAEILDQSAKFLESAATRFPKVQKLLEVPQSSDKHAEGRTIREHYLHIIAAIQILLTDAMRSEELGTDRLNIGGIEKEWDETIDFVQQHQELVYAFGLAHDLGKYDFFAAYAKKPEGEALGFWNKKEFFERQKGLTVEEREKLMQKYRDALDTYTQSHPELTEAEANAKFFEEYGVTVTYIGHERGLDIPENAATAEKISDQFGLTDPDKSFLKFLTEQHVSGHLSFEKGVRDYHALIQNIDAAGLDRHAAMRGIQATMMVDGLFGARKIQPNTPGPGLSVAVDKFRLFYEAEQAYPAFAQAEKDKVEREQIMRRVLAIEKKWGLRGGDLGPLGVLLPPSGFTQFIERIHRAVMGVEEFRVIDGEITPKMVRVFLDRIQNAREEYAADAKETRPSVSHDSLRVKREAKEFLVPRGSRKELVEIGWLRTNEDGTEVYQGATANDIKSIFLERGEADLAARVETGLQFVEAVAAAGGRALFVGGSVRDQIMGTLPKDVDIEVYGLDGDAVERIASAFGRVDGVGKAFGILKITKDGGEIDVSLPRTDSKIGAGHRGFAVKVDPHMTMREAAKRRDFSWNALAQDPLTGEIFDSYNGVEDARKRVLRVTDEERFRDDPLRVLRGAQFVARFGLTVEPETERIIREVTPQLKELARERIFEEWKKLFLKSNRPSLGLQTLRHWGVIHELYPEVVAAMSQWDTGTERDTWVESLTRVDTARAIARREKVDEKKELTLLLSSLCFDMHADNFDARAPKRFKGNSPVAVEVFLDKLGVPNYLYDAVLRLLEHRELPAQIHRDYLQNPTSPKNDGAVRRLAKKVHPATVDLAALLAEAEDFGQAPFLDPRQPDQLLLHFGSGAEKWLRGAAVRLGVLEQKPEPAVTGQQLLDLGIGFEKLKGSDQRLMGEVMLAIDHLRDEFGLSNVEIIQRVVKLVGEGISLKELSGRLRS